MRSLLVLLLTPLLLAGQEVQLDWNFHKPTSNGVRSVRGSSPLDNDPFTIGWRKAVKEAEETGKMVTVTLPAMAGPGEYKFYPDGRVSGNGTFLLEGDDDPPENPVRKQRVVKGDTPETKKWNTRNECFDYYVTLAKERGEPVKFSWKPSGGSKSWNLASPDGRVKLLSQEPMPRQEVAAGYTFPVQPRTASKQPFLPEYVARGLFPKNHQCPNCRHISAPDTGNWIIRGGNPNGSHVHQCEKCGYRGTH